VQQLLTAKQVAGRCNISLPMVYILRQEYSIPYVKFGPRSFRFPADDLEIWLKSKLEMPDRG